MKRLCYTSKPGGDAEGHRPGFRSCDPAIRDTYEGQGEAGHSGAVFGRSVIKATIYKKDMDSGVVLYEVMPTGELFRLSYFLGRAGYAKDMSVRKLLTPGKVESIPFD